MSRSQLAAAAEQAALREIAHEEFRAEVEAQKATIRERRMRPWWKRLLPFRVRIEKV